MLLYASIQRKALQCTFITVTHPKIDYPCCHLYNNLRSEVKVAALMLSL